MTRPRCLPQREQRDPSSMFGAAEVPRNVLRDRTIVPVPRGAHNMRMGTRQAGQVFCPAGHEPEKGRRSQLTCY